MVFGSVERVVLELAQGFLDFPRNNLRPGRDTLDKVWFTSYITLLRLLYVRYAELLGILPAGQGNYARFYSLQGILNQLGEVEEKGSRLWGQLGQLWQVVGRGNDGLGVAPYGGNLFGDVGVMDKVRVGDKALKSVLLWLPDDPEVIYGILDVFEQLLDYALGFAMMPMVFEAGNYVPLTVDMIDGAGDVLPAGSVYLLPPKTPKPFTPDEALEATVVARLAPLLEQMAEPFVDDEGYVEDVEGLTGAFFGLSVLDPYVESGRVLLAASLYLGDYLHQLYPDEEQVSCQQQAAKQLVYGATPQPLAVILTSLRFQLALDVDISDRVVVGDCLLGARPADIAKAVRRRRARSKAVTQLGLWQELEPEEPVAFNREQGQLLAYMWVARRLGLSISNEEWRRWVQFILTSGLNLPRFARLQTEAKKLAETHQFFHWELAFDEVERFDGVVGDREVVKWWVDTRPGLLIPARLQDLKQLR